MIVPGRPTVGDAAGSLRSMPGRINVTMKPSWLSAWFLRLAARPFVCVDGREYPAKWGVDVGVDVAPGRHLIAGGIRYPGFSSLLGARDVEIDVADGSTTSFVARNGFVNSEPFYLTRMDDDGRT